MSAADGDRVVAFSRVAGAVCHDAANLLVLRDLAKQMGQHRGNIRKAMDVRGMLSVIPMRKTRKLRVAVNRRL